MKQDGEGATLADLRALHRLEMELEQKWVEGPMSHWDGDLLQNWRYEVRGQIARLEIVLELQMSAPSTIRERFAAALRREVVIHLNAGEIDTPAFDRIVQAMEETPTVGLLLP